MRKPYVGGLLSAGLLLVLVSICVAVWFAGGGVRRANSSAAAAVSAGQRRALTCAVTGSVVSGGPALHASVRGFADAAGCHAQQLSVTRADGTALCSFSFAQTNIPNAYAQTLGLRFADLNADGCADLELRGSETAATGAYTCLAWLWDEAKQTFAACPSYAGIPNPVPDAEGKRVLSFSEDQTASRCWAMYSYESGAFVRTRELTETVVDGGASPLRWRYLEKQRGTDGKMAVVNDFVSKDGETDSRAVAYYMGADWNLTGGAWACGIYGAASGDEADGQQDE